MTRGRTPADDSVAAAQAEVDGARGRLVATIDEIHMRISPRNLMEGAITEVRTRSTDFANSASDVAREKPGVVVAGAAAVGLLLARKPLARFFGKLLNRSKETPARKPR